MITSMRVYRGPAQPRESEIRKKCYIMMMNLCFLIHIVVAWIIYLIVFAHYFRRLFAEDLPGGVGGRRGVPVSGVADERRSTGAEVEVCPAERTRAASTAEDNAGGLSHNHRGPETRARVHKHSRKATGRGELLCSTRVYDDKFLPSSPGARTIYCTEKYWKIILL